MQIILVVVHLFLAIGLVGLILIQHGKGADMGAAFGSGASATVFGARGSASFLTRATAAFATLFFVTSMAMAYYAAQGREEDSILDSLQSGEAVKTEQNSEVPAPPAMPTTPAESEVPSAPVPPAAPQASTPATSEGSAAQGAGTAVEQTMGAPEAQTQSASPEATPSIPVEETPPVAPGEAGNKPE